MNRMSDLEREYIQDLREKKSTARSASNRRARCGKGGRVRFPSDCLSEKQLKNMNGECKSYKLNSPMRWKYFMEMPDDLKVCYVRAIRLKYNTPDKVLAEMFGVHPNVVYRTFKKLGLSKGSGAGGSKKWDKEGFCNWWGVNYAENVDAFKVKKEIDIREGKETPSVDHEFTPLNKKQMERLFGPSTFNTIIIPEQGAITLEGDINDILRTLSGIVKNGYVRMSVDWSVVPEPKKVYECDCAKD